MFKFLVVLAIATLSDAHKVEKIAKGGAGDNVTHTTNGGYLWNTKVQKSCTTKCASVEWIRNQDSILFRISGNSTGYVAFAISSNQAMGPADDAYICARSSPGSSDVKIMSAYLIGHKPPGIVGMISGNTSISDGMLKCSFSRPMSVTKFIEGKNVTWDISNTQYHLLYAEGVVNSSGNVQYHHPEHRTATMNSYNLASDDIEASSVPPQPDISKTTASPTNPGGGAGDNVTHTTNRGYLWNTKVQKSCTTKCASVEWIRNQDSILFRISGNSTGYVAFAISSNQAMGPADDAYICARSAPGSSDVKIMSAYLIGHKPPGIVGMISGNTSISDGMLKCSFSRPMSVTKFIEGKNVTWDISNTQYHLLYAEGVVNSSGNVQYHHPEHRTATMNSYNLASDDIEASSVPPQPDTSKTTASPTNPGGGAGDNVTHTTNGGYLWNTKVQKSCTTKCASVEWIRNQDSILFRISGNSTGYVAFAISSNQAMGPADDAYICARSSPGSSDVKIMSAYLIGHKPPGIVGMIPGNTSISDGMLKCSFSRPMSVTKFIEGKNVTWDISNTQYHLLYAEGVVNSSGNVQYHHPEHRTATMNSYNLASDDIVVTSSTAGTRTTTTTSVATESTQIPTVGAVKTTSKAPQLFVSSWLMLLPVLLYSKLI